MHLGMTVIFLDLELVRELPIDLMAGVSERNNLTQ